ncbi:MAG: exodeoxyribonuclease-1 [Cellvibrionaceae bacterium]|jgi:exodeoxyribonuclease-1
MSSIKTLFWHDYETWGAKPSSDKPSQFAGVRTDESLKIIGEPLVVYCQPTNDCLPQPQACLITGITPQKAFCEGIPEPQFFQKIHDQLSEPGTCGVGYNSIRFDDEVSRYGFYRNFFDPYEREWKNGNSRWDIIDMVRLVYALRPDTLRWPLREDGLPSFKLELLSTENGLEHTSAHDALSDVKATIALAKLIKQRQPQLYDYCYELRNKQRVNSLIDIEQRKPLLHISSRFSAKQGCAALVTPLAKHPKNSNSVICYDLSVNPAPLLALSAEEILERVFVKQGELPEGVERIPLKEIHLNKSPIITTPKLLDDTAAKRLGIDKIACEQHWQQLKDFDVHAKLVAIYSQRRFAPSIDPEQQLYDGFINNHDRQLFDAIRQAAPESLSSLSNQLKDKRLKALLFRYRARHHNETLTEEEQTRWEEWRYVHLTDVEAGGSITLENYFSELDELSASGTADLNIIEALRSHGDSLLA